MAYFANGSEGFILDDQCADCLHADEVATCPIMFVSVKYNYDQLGNEGLISCLEDLVDKKGQCRMRPYIMALKKGPRPDPDTRSIFEKNRSF